MKTTNNKTINIADKITPKISYKGAVKIQYVRNGKKIEIKKHNIGKIALFTGICRYLAGYNSAKYLPKKLDALTLVELDDGTQEFKSVLADPIPFNVQPKLFDENDIQSENKCKKVQYGFNIQRSSLLQASSNIMISRFNLLTDNNTVCATIDLNGNEQISTNISNNILVYWTLHIDN